MSVPAIIALSVGGFLLFSVISIFFSMSYATSRSTLKGAPKEVDPYAGLDAEKFASAKELMVSRIDMLCSEEYETVSIKSRDGLRLFARYYHKCDGAPLHILVHGYRSTPLRDFVGAGCETLLEGHNLLLIHQRATYPSEGRSVAFGLKEKYDVQDWINYSVERFGDIDIVLMGMSMGGATVLQVSELDLPENVRCIIADCPFSSAEDEIRLVTKNQGAPKFAYFFVRMGSIIYAGTDLNRASAAESVKNAKLPILILHGEEDRLVPVEMGKKIYDACTSEKKMVTFPGAQHATAYLSDPDRYTAELKSFYEKYLRK